MKTIILLLISLILSLRVATYAQDQCESIGWANYTGTTYVGAPTGGGTATPIIVTTFADFKAAAESSGYKVIYIANSMGAGYKDTNGDVVYLTSNKTIIGYPGVILSASIRLENVKNIIIRNIKVEGPPATDASQGWDNLTIQNGSSRIWIDHCEFENGGDGNLDVVKGSDNVSVTWCVFTYKEDGLHNLSNLIGSSDNEPASWDKLNVTYFNCWWKDCADRQPRVRYGKVHVANCYFSMRAGMTSSNGTGAGYKANIRVENCAYENISNPCKILSGTTEGICQPINCTFTNCTGNTSGGSAGGYTVFTPPYSLTLVPPANVKALVTDASCGAGTTMDSPTQCGCTFLDLTSGIASQSVNTGSAITDIVYTWGGYATDVTIANLPAGLISTKNTPAKTITISGIPTTGNTYTITTIQSSGTASTASGTISVVPFVPATLVLTSGTASQSVIAGTAITNIVFTWGGGATDVSVTGLGTDLIATKDVVAQTITISGAPNSVGTTNYSIETVGGSASSVIETGIITSTAPMILATPTNVFASTDLNSITVGWTPVATATGYVINLCKQGTGPAIGNQWNFAGTWTINASNADANLVVDSDPLRLNYVPATTDATLKFANGTPIPDVAGLLFTQGGGTKIRLGFGKALLYLNGANIVLTIPCGIGDKITVVGPAGNPTSVDRGYSVVGGTLNTSESSASIDATGILTVAGDTATWVYTATSTALKLTTMTGGMNIKSIVINPNSSLATCTEYIATGGSTDTYTILGLEYGTTYNYEVKATNGQPSESSPYSTVANISTITGIMNRKSKIDVSLYPNPTVNAFQISGIEGATTISIFEVTGKLLLTKLVIENEPIEINTLTQGVYIVKIDTAKGTIAKLLHRL